MLTRVPRLLLPIFVLGLPLGLYASPALAACAGAAAVCAEAAPDRFPLIVGGQPATLLVDPTDDPGVLRAATDLQSDLAKVGGRVAAVRTGISKDIGAPIIVGTLGRDRLVDRLVREGKLDVRGVAGSWEGFLQQVVDHPAPGIDRALVIAGADKRGTIFGLYDLSRRMGVSPWAWWADVPVARKPDLYVLPGGHVEKPAVRYRGIFLNDEDPSLKGWVDSTYGGFNHRFYARVFELILRLKGDFLWPAMWGKAFADDDPLNPKLANLYGVVMGTSHHEPMMRAQAEWQRYGHGPWDYTVNAPELREFWRKGIERMDGNESLVTIGMRGNGDKPMTQGTAVDLLEQIVADQRKIIADVTGKPASATPQVWALYKEVQAYYDKGMRVPDDVTLLFSDDNWGNIRRLPAPGRVRGGGYGVYYHFDYVGGPRNYKWINTNQVERTFEQMHLAHAYGANQLWIVNVGDLKPMELPVSFFLDYAWDPDAWPVERIGEYTRDWAADQFGPAHADEIGELLTRYTQYNARRKPELLSPDTYSLTNYREWQRVAAAYDALAERARQVRRELPPQDDDAYVELVLYPVEASANLNDLYYATALNRLYAQQGRAATNRMADRVKALFQRDAALTRLYNDEVAHGKWRHMMDQTHIGYTSWQEPKVNVMPQVRTIAVPTGASLGVAVEGDNRAWPGTTEPPVLHFSRYGTAARYIELFDRGRGALSFTAQSAEPWVRLSSTSGPVGEQTRLEVSIDWARAPQGLNRAPILVRGSDGTTVTITAELQNRPAVPSDGAFIEGDGVVAIEAAHFDRAVAGQGVRWVVIPNLGRTLSGVTTFPVTAASQSPGASSPHLDYKIRLFDAGAVNVQVTLAPSLDFRGQGGLRYAVSIDDRTPVVVNMEADPSERAWAEAVADDARILTTRLNVDRPGEHVLKLWRVDPGVVLERVVVDAGGLKPSYLGPPESERAGAAAKASAMALRRSLGRK